MRRISASGVFSVKRVELASIVKLKGFERGADQGSWLAENGKKIGQDLNEIRNAMYVP